MGAGEWQRGNELSVMTTILKHQGVKGVKQILAEWGTFGKKRYPVIQNIIHN
jgi:hypothetical protein